MSTAPQPYERITSFYSYEATYPSLPKSGASLDAEFNAVRAALNATQDRLAEIQRDDGLLANASVHPQSLTSETYVLLNSDFIPRGSWLTATVYDPGDLVEHLGLNYLATIAHSSDDFDVDLAAGKWQAFGGYPTAAQVVFAPGGSVGSVSVQDAIIELDGDVQGKQAAHANLAALAGLTGAANKAFYFTGAGAMAVADATAYGRSLWAAESPVAARTVLEITLGVSANNVVQLDGTAKLPAIDGSQLTNVVPANGSVDAAQMAATLNLSGKTITLPAANTPALTKYFESTQQVITAAGALTIAHGLAVKPKLIQAALVCLTAEHGYSINDEVMMNPGVSSSGATGDRGLAVVTDATNLNVRYGSNASVFTLLNKTTGANAAPTLANWRLVLRAWA